MRQALREKIDLLVQQKEALLYGEGLKAKKDNLKTAIDYIDAKLAKLTKFLARIENEWINDSVTKTEARLTTKLVPEQFKKFEETLTDTKNWIIRPINDESSDSPQIAVINIEGELKNFITDLNLKVVLIPDLTYAVRDSACNEPRTQSADTSAPRCSLKGFRYRVPATGTIQLIKQTDNSSDNEVLIQSSIYVAQYGPIASLPAKVKGSSGNIELALDVNTGGLSKVTVGATSQPTSTISDYLGLIGDIESKHAATKKAEKEAEEGKEAAELEAENKLLELKKTNIELKSSLEALEAE